MSGANEVLLVPLSRRKTPPLRSSPWVSQASETTKETEKYVDSIKARWASRLFSAHLERGAKSALEASSLQLVGAGGSRPLISALAPGSRGRGSSAPGRDPSRSLARQEQAGKG